MAQKSIGLDDKLHWYKDAIIYELHIKAFRDSNGDGIGDFGGLLEKLDYLQELGVTAIWVLPFYPSPLKDDGYDIADYYSINPAYGNIEQFKRFLEEAHKRNLKVITELVINHTSDQHPWFQRARTALKGSPERDFYVWTDDPLQYKDVRIIFQDFEASNWTWDPVAQQYYWHRFFHHQPDLNYDSLQVQEEVFKILDYWCAMGVDGFRLDAVPYLFEREGTNGENLPETHAFLKKLRAHIDEKFPGTVFLAEANMWPEDSASYFGDGDECHMNYHFPVMPRMFMALQREDRYPITDIFEQTPAIPETCQWAMFLRNHDELTLEMVTDEERDYMYKVYAKDPKAKINLGIRHRLAPLMENSRRKIELMNSLLFSMPGTPVLYYGDEIGMGDNFYLGDRDGVRTPMQWSPDRNAGFSQANPHKLYLPVILDPEYHYESVNVEMQRGNTSSLLWFMKRIITMRKRFRAFSRGDMRFINVENPKVLAFTRRYEDETLLIIVNLSKFSQAAEVNLEEYRGYQPTEVFSKNKFPSIREGHPYFFTLSPHTFHWFMLEKPAADTGINAELPLLQVNTWEALLTPELIAAIENNLLPRYLPKTSWFESNKRTVYHISLIHRELLPVKDQLILLLLAEVQYESGLPELYQLPFAFVKEEAARKLGESCPQAIVARINIGGEEGILCDALYTSSFQQALFAGIREGQPFPLGKSRLIFYGNEHIKHPTHEGENIRSRIHATEKGYTSIAYNNLFLLKMYRKLDPATNPDLEVTRYLSETAQFPHVPRYIGTVEWQTEKDSFVLGMMESLIENHGDGYSFMLERIDNFIERILARDRTALDPCGRKGHYADPVSFEELPEEEKELLGTTASEQARLLGLRTAELHIALASARSLKDFKPEEYSLHYQRSLFSSMQSLVREAFGSKKTHLKDLPESLRQETENILARKEEVLSRLKRIYAKKLDVIKIRIHGDYHLGKVLFTGKDMMIHDFSGDPTRSFSERRLKRSPVRDVAGMIRSFHYVAHEGFLSTNQIPKEEVGSLMPFAEYWAHYMSSFFIRAYLEGVKGTFLVPKEKEDLKVMLDTFLLEKAIYDLSYELNNRPEKVPVPVYLINRSIE